MTILPFFFVMFILGLYGLHAETKGNEDGQQNKRILLQDNYYTLVSKLDSLTAQMATLTSKVGTLTSEMATLTSKVATLETQQETPKKRVVFKAMLEKSLAPGTDQLIVFDDIIFNQGNAYHHGMFIAPYNGTYLFSVTICSLYTHYIDVVLLRNGNLIGQVTAGDYDFNDCSSETTVTELKAGDDVTVQHKGNVGDSIYGDDHIRNSFTGVFLF